MVKKAEGYEDKEIFPTLLLATEFNPDEITNDVVTPAAAKKVKEDLECSICGEDFVKLGNLNRRIDTVVLEGGIGCSKDYCERVFETTHEMYAQCSAQCYLHLQIPCLWHNHRSQ